MTAPSKRLCLLSAHFPPDLSGDGDYTYFLANALARIGCDVQVITAVGEMDTVLYPLARGVRVHRVVKTWGVRGLPDLLRAVRSLRADVLVVQYAPHAFDPRGITLGVNLLPALIRVGTRIRVIVNFHEVYTSFDRSLRHCLGSLWQRAMGFLIATPSHVLTAVSTEWPRLLRCVGVRKPTHVIPVGSNIPRADVGAGELRAIRNKLGVGPDTLLIGCFGSAGVHRDAGLLLATVRRAHPKHSLKLVWLGESGLCVERRTESRRVTQTHTDGGDVIWTGPLPHPEISRTMSACDLFVLPFTDGISTKRGTLAAALLHGLPVLTTRGKRLDDVFVHGENIYLAPLGDEQAFGERLLELARRSELRTRLAKGGRVLHDAHFRWDLIAKQVARLAEDRSDW